MNLANDVSSIVVKPFPNTSCLPLGVLISIGAISIKTLLMENKTITSLDIRWNKIYDEGAMVISEGLQFNHALTILKIEYCELSVEGMYGELYSTLHLPTRVFLISYFNPIYKF